MLILRSCLMFYRFVWILMSRDFFSGSQQENKLTTGDYVSPHGKTAWKKKHVGTCVRFGDANNVRTRRAVLFLKK